MKLIDEEELAQLLINSAELHALKAGGVDNWHNYDYALHEEEGEYFQKIIDMSTEEIVKNYKDAKIC